ncbi:MAG: hypothetical protein AAF220_08165 [Pseudomonadota bacterium]
MQAPHTSASSSSSQSTLNDKAKSEKPRTGETPRDRRNRWIKQALSGPLGDFVFRPWVDKVGYTALNTLTVPLSAVWAAAVRADGEVTRFRAEYPISRPLIAAERWALRQIAANGRKLAQVDKLWHRAFFSSHSVPHERLVFLETERRSASSRWRASAMGLARLVLQKDSAPHAQSPSRVRFAIPGTAEVENAHGHRITNPKAAFAIPSPLPQIDRSHTITRNGKREYWLRFPSPGSRMGDAAYAHVTEPAEAPIRGSFVFSSGLGIEPEHMPAGGLSPLHDVVDAGLRIVELETPWHGRRLPWGYFAGERIFATAPLGALDLFDAMVREIGVMIAWARNQPTEETAAPVGIGGVSLGAIAGSLAISHMRHWPEKCRPDGAFLIVPGAPLADISFDGAIPKLFGVDKALSKAAWTRPLLDQYSALTDPDRSAMMT